MCVPAGTTLASGLFRRPAATAAGRLDAARGDSARHAVQRSVTHVQDDPAALTALFRACTDAGEMFAAPETFAAPRLIGASSPSLMI